jgi:hypothetical protein
MKGGSVGITDGEFVKYAVEMGSCGMIRVAMFLMSRTRRSTTIKVFPQQFQML